MPRDNKHLSAEDAEAWESYTSKLREAREVGPPRHIYSDDALPDRLDLHGRTIHEAWMLFESFVASHVAMCTRRVTVITGSSGRMREEFAHWCDRTVGVDSCQPIVSRRGKVGAYLVTLRRSRF